jgi:hypothetical protein
MLALSLLGAVAGFVVVPPLAITGSWTLTPNPNGKPIYEWKYGLFWLWGNHEDGVIPPAIVNGKPYLTGWPDWLRAIAWCAWRNKFSNLRFTEPFGFTIDPKRIDWIGNDQNLYEALPNDSRPVLWSLTWQGYYAGLWVVWRGRIQFRIGWTLVPDDAKNYNPVDLRQRYCGFSIQLNRPG